MIILIVMLTVSVVYANPSNNSLNARFTRWQEAENIIHIFVYNDHGRPEQDPALVTVGDVVIMGYEWGGTSIDEISEFLINEAIDLTLSIDGGATFSVKNLFQEPFIAATQLGPRWTWDHDGDGPGDGDGDGMGDWNGAVSFFRYRASGLSVGTHTFLFTFIDNGAKTEELITVQVVP